MKRAGLPLRFRTLVVQVVAEERRLDILAELTRGLVTTKRNQPDTLSLGSLPLAVIPRSRNDEIRVLRIALFRVAKNLPRSPGVFLISKSRHIQVGNGRGVKLAYPGFTFPELVVIGMFDRRVPVRNGAV